MSTFLEFNTDGTLLRRLVKGLYTIPKTAVPVDEELFNRTVQETDGTWTIGADGVITKEPLIAVPIDYAANERQWRDAEIERVRWLRERHRDETDIGIATSITAEQFEELLAYIQGLRDWPESEQFPAAEYRPEPPAWVADQQK